MSLLLVSCKSFCLRRFRLCFSVRLDSHTLSGCGSAEMHTTTLTVDTCHIFGRTSFIIVLVASIVWMWRPPRRRIDLARLVLAASKCSTLLAFLSFFPLLLHPCHVHSVWSLSCRVSWLMFCPSAKPISHRKHVLLAPNRFTLSRTCGVFFCLLAHVKCDELNSVS